MPVNQQSEAAARLWLGGAAMQDIQALVGGSFAVEDAIRMRILEAAESGTRPVNAIAEMERQTIEAAREAAVLKPKRSTYPDFERTVKVKRRPAAVPAEPTQPKQSAPALNLTGYPAELQNPMAINQRRVWDALKAADAPMDPRSILDAVSAHVTLETDDPEKLIVNALYLMKGKGLVERTEDRPARWRRA